MLRNDVVEAVASGNFSIWPVSHIDEGIEILTGVGAGTADPDGNYPADSINGLAVARLKKMAEQQKKFDSSDKEKDNDTANHC
jgi:predicted ATP-dependent protease